MNRRADERTIRAVRADRLNELRQRRLELMAGFCRFWNITPHEYAELTVEELDAMTRYANDEIAQRKRAASKAKSRRGRR